MYSDKLVAAIKVADKILREFKDVVVLPFGKEYSIYLKNLNTVNASITVSIDGKDVLGKYALVLEPGKELNLRRSISNDNTTIGNAFKFIEMTDKISEYRGITAEDGLVRIEFQFECEEIKIPKGPIKNQFGDSPYWSQGDWNIDCSYNQKRPNLLRGPGDTHFGQQVFINTIGAVAQSVELGVTVPGSIVEDQIFTPTPYKQLEPEIHAIVFKLSGNMEGVPAKQVVTVKTKPKCITCGKVNPSTAKFCSTCGTSLQVV